MIVQGQRLVEFMSGKDEDAKDGRPGLARSSA